MLRLPDPEADQGFADLDFGDVAQVKCQNALGICERVQIDSKCISVRGQLFVRKAGSAGNIIDNILI